MKIGLVADTHVGRNAPRVVGELRREAYRYAFSRAIDIFINESVDYVIHAGDLFEKKSMTPSDSMFVKNEFHRLINSIKENKGKTVKILIVRGNHDGTSDNSTLEYVEHPLAEYLTVIGDKTLRGKKEFFEDGNLFIVGIGHHPYITSKFEEIKPIIKESLSKASGNPLLMLHAYISGFHDLPPGIPKHSILALQDLEDLDVKIIICGHHHVRKDPMEFKGKQIITPGATEAIDLADESEHGVSILEDSSYKFIPIEPLHDIHNIRVSSKGAVKPLDWFKSEAEIKLTSYTSELDASDRMGILRIVLEGKSVEDPLRLDAELDNLSIKAKENNQNLLHVQVENRVECTKQTFFTPLGGQKEFLHEAMKPLDDLIKEALPIIEDIDMALEEKASQRTSLLTKSDRQPFVDKWIEILREKVKK